MDNVFYNKLKKYDINTRTAYSMQQITSKNESLFNCSDEDIEAAYKQWYLDDDTYEDDAITEAKMAVHIFNLLKKANKDGVCLPKDTILTTGWGAERLELYYKRGLIVVSEETKKCTDVRELINRLNVVKDATIQITLGGFVCPLCKHNVSDVFYECGKCGTHIRPEYMVHHCTLASVDVLMQALHG